MTPEKVSDLPAHLQDIDLVEARRLAAAKFSAIGQRMLDQYGVTLRKPAGGLYGRAWVQGREIVAPWPTNSRKRLYILAHEIGHVVLDHRSQQPRHVEEMQAEKWAHDELRRCSVPVPRSMTKRAKRYVERKINQALRRGAKHIDPEARRYANR